MAVSIKSEREIQLMRESCKLLAKVHEELAKAVQPGVSTLAKLFAVTFSAFCAFTSPEFPI